MRNSTTALNNLYASPELSQPRSKIASRPMSTPFGSGRQAPTPCGRNLKIIDLDTQQMMPAADRIIEGASEGARLAAERLQASQSRTKSFILWVGFAAVALGLVLSFVIGRSITRPLEGLSEGMRRLAAGETSVRIPATRARDEIGAMARTVIVFRDTMLERERLARTQIEDGKRRETRSQTIASTIARFERSVGDGLDKVRAAAGRLETASSRLNASADGMSVAGADRREPGAGGVRQRSQPPRARSRNWRRRSPRSRRRPARPPRSPAARSPKPAAPPPRCRNSPRPRPASARWSI